MKRTVFNFWQWVAPAATSLMLIAPAASGQDIDLDALMQQLDGEREPVAELVQPPEAVEVEETGIKTGSAETIAVPVPVLRKLPSSYEEVAAYAHRFTDHDVDRTSQIVAHVCDLLMDVDADLVPRDARICVSRNGED